MARSRSAYRRIYNLYNPVSVVRNPTPLPSVTGSGLLRRYGRAMDTPTQQRNAVSQGVGLGLLLNGRSSIPYAKMHIDLTFAASWRDWSHRSHFPAVSSKLRNGLDPIHIVTFARQRSSTFFCYWKTEGSALDVALRDPDWTTATEDVSFAASMIDEDVPADAWRELARPLIAQN